MNLVSLQVVGCGDAFGSGGQNNTCFYVKCNSTQLLIDCGATSLPALKKYGISVRQLDLIILTHFHGDHFGGVPFLLLELATYGQVKQLTIISPPGGKEKIKKLLELLYPASIVLEKLQIEFIEYQPYQTFIAQQISIKAFPVIHTKEALPHGIRISIQGKIISYSGDTEWTDVLIALAENADLFICECNFYNIKAKGHLNYRHIEQNLHLLNHKNILLTHFDTEMLHNLQHLKLDYATDGQLLQL